MPRLAFKLSGPLGFSLGPGSNYPGIPQITAHAAQALARQRRERP
jgi:hypothetical protein